MSHEEKKISDFLPEQIRQNDNENWLHPWERMRDIGQANRTIIEHAEGIYVYDEHGKKLIDSSAGMWCVQIGYGRLDMAEAIAAQVKRLPYMSPFSLTCEPSARLARKLAELAPGDLNHVFFTTGGSTAVDSALRFVHFYNNILHRPNKKHIISQGNAYHGATYLCGQITSRDKHESWFDVSTPFVHSLSSVESIFRKAQMTMQEFCDVAVLELEEKILELGAENVGAFIAEPIQSAGGVIVPPKGYLRRCWEICRKYDVLYISDEVVTGFGRLGSWFSSKDVFDVEPDIMTCAKGLSSGYLPIGAVLISDKLIKEIGHEHARGADYGQGFTYSGHPVCCVAALKNIEILENERILEHVREISPYFLEKLHELSNIPIVFETRGVGLLAAIECHATSSLVKEGPVAANAKLGKRIAQDCRESGLLIRPIESILVLSPPLIITKKQIDLMFKILRDSLERTMREMDE